MSSKKINGHLFQYEQFGWYRCRRCAFKVQLEFLDTSRNPIRDRLHLATAGVPCGPWNLHRIADDLTMITGQRVTQEEALAAALAIHRSSEYVIGIDPADPARESFSEVSLQSPRDDPSNQ